MTEADYLRLVDEVIAAGPFKDTWESLGAYKVPKWYEDAKFGIFIHWGVYSVPAFGSEWYARTMYQQGSREYEHHLKTYGPHKDFGYKDFIPMLKAEAYDPEAWADLFREAGARYVMPVAEHHDGFAMYDCGLSEWTAAKMGPKKDVVGMLKEAVEKRGMKFCMSNHRAEHCWFFNGGLAFDSDVADPANEDFYWEQQPVGDDTHDIYSERPTKGQCESWLARMCEMVEGYRPSVVWFDWWIHNLGFKPYIRKFAAYYYNRAAEWGMGVAINYKYDAYAHGTAVYDVERGQLEGMRPDLWQTDTSVAKNSWCYTEGNKYKDPVDIVCDLVDIVSKNGLMLLNIGPKADGTIPDEDAGILREVGRWLRVNGEGIYGTRTWKAFGEGPTKVEEDAFKDGDGRGYTEGDVRYTYKGGVIYAFAMRAPKDGVLTMRRMARSKSGDFDILCVTLLDGAPQGEALGSGQGKAQDSGRSKPVDRVASRFQSQFRFEGGQNEEGGTAVGGGALPYERDYDSMRVDLSGTKAMGSKYPVCVKIVID